MTATDNAREGDGVADPAYPPAQVALDRERYFKGMARMDGHTTCLAIERKYGLDGYPPEIVSVALQAGAEGRDMNAAVDAYIGEPDDDDGAPR